MKIKKYSYYQLSFPAFEVYKSVKSHYRSGTIPARLATGDSRAVNTSLVGYSLDDWTLSFSGTIFAYGQTGTGKTFTMEGMVFPVMIVISDKSFITMLLG